MAPYLSSVFLKRIFLAVLWAGAGFLAWAGDELRPTPVEAILSSNAPVITEFSPLSGAEGDAILIRGDGLAGTIEVKFNGVPAQFEVAGDIDPRRRMIVARVPQKATTGPITVTTEQGTVTTTDPFVILDGKPVIESFSPASGPPGTTIQIHGQNLKYATSVLFNGQKAERWGVGIDPVIIHLLATVPATATTGPVTVTGPFGSAISEASFTVTAPASFTVQNWPVETEAGMTLMLRVNDNFLVRDVQLNGTSISFIGFAPTDLIISIPTNAISGPLTIITANETVTSPQPLSGLLKAGHQKCASGVRARRHRRPTPG